MTSTPPSSSAQQPSYNKKSPTVKRILREAAELASSPSTSYHASPLEHNLFEWHFTLRGPPSTPYAGGIYHGRITLPPSYPLRPPSFRFLTPSGRFEVNREICLSISGHHEDTWQPAWGVRTAVVALRSFMEQEAEGQLGGMECSEEVRKKMAEESRTWRCKECGIRWEEVLGEEEKEGGREEVPDELRLAYRGQNKDQQESASPSTPTTPAPVGSEVEPSPGAVGVVVDSAGIETPGLHRRLPAPQQHQNTHQQSSTPQPQPQAFPQQPLPQIQIIHQEDENFWVDRAIGVCLILLAGIVLKRLVHIDVI